MVENMRFLVLVIASFIHTNEPSTLRLSNATLNHAKNVSVHFSGYSASVLL